MKNRISSIMDMGRKRRGMIIICAALILTLITGLAFAINAGAPEPDPIPAYEFILLPEGNESPATGPCFHETHSIYEYYIDEDGLYIKEVVTACGGFIRVLLSEEEFESAIRTSHCPSGICLNWGAWRLNPSYCFRHCQGCGKSQTAEYCDDRCGIERHVPQGLENEQIFPKPEPGPEPTSEPVLTPEPEPLPIPESCECGNCTIKEDVALMEELGKNMQNFMFLSNIEVPAAIYAVGYNAHSSSTERELRVEITFLPSDDQQITDSQMLAFAELVKELFPEIKDYNIEISYSHR